MPSKYWIKLYHEILDDPKMGTMPELLFARCIKLFLLAGDYARDGLLPPVADVGWRLRLSAEVVESDLIELQRLGITSLDDGRWRITKWQERQGPMTAAHRGRLRRSEAQHLEYQTVGPANMGPRPDFRTKRDQIPAGEEEIDRDRDTDTEAGDRNLAGKFWDD